MPLSAELPAAGRPRFGASVQLRRVEAPYPRPRSTLNPRGWPLAGADRWFAIRPLVSPMAGPLLAVAAVWPFGRSRNGLGRRLSVCPTLPNIEQPSWRQSVRLALQERCRTGDLARWSLLASWSAWSEGRARRLAARRREQRRQHLKLVHAIADAAPTQPWTPEPESPAARSRRELLRISADFESVLVDLVDPRAENLRVRLRLCTTPQELWHLRPDLFNLVSRLHSQTEAQQRLSQVDRHFPSRKVGAAPRS